MKPRQIVRHTKSALMAVLLVELPQTACLLELRGPRRCQPATQAPAESGTIIYSYWLGCVNAYLG
jgi:hypothetical protein